MQIKNGDNFYVLIMFTTVPFLFNDEVYIDVFLAFALEP